MPSPLFLYAAMVVAAAFQEEFAPLAGALAAHHGHGDIWLVALACAFGSWLHGLTLYSIGRRARTLLQRPSFARPLERLREHRLKALLGIRFAYGLRLTLPLACGAADIPAGAFALWTAVSSVVWAALFATIGWFAGEVAVTLIRDLRHYEVQAGAVLLAFGAAFYVWRRRRVRDETGPIVLTPGRMDASLP
jgi:membrane protein DedA with SNARE-associated domain